MRFVLSESMDGRVIEVIFSCQLTKEIYREFVPLAEDAIKKHGKIRLLFVMTGFQGWNACTLWEDIKCDFKYFDQIERLAIVGEAKWETGMSTFCRPFSKATIKYFEHGDLEQARKWIICPDVQSEPSMAGTKTDTRETAAS